jgi:hypothetical protein
MDPLFKTQLFRAMDGALLPNLTVADLPRCFQLIALADEASASERSGQAMLVAGLLCAVAANFVAHVGSIGLAYLLWCICFGAVAYGSATLLSGNRRTKACAYELLSIALRNGGPERGEE